jgi:hypothetical protein
MEIDPTLIKKIPARRIIKPIDESNAGRAVKRRRKKKERKEREKKKRISFPGALLIK